MYVCPLPVAGLVHAYRGGTVEHARHRGFQPGGDPARDMAGGPPRDAWESAHGLLAGDRRRPRALHLEIPGEPAVRLRPRHLGDHHAMLRARHARRQAHELDPIAAEVLVAPSPFAAPVVVLGALAPATRATQRALPAPHPDHQCGSGTQRRVVHRHVLDDHAFDVQQPFEYVLHKAFPVSGFPEQKYTIQKTPPHTLGFNGSPTNHHPRKQHKSRKKPGKTSPALGSLPNGKPITLYRMLSVNSRELEAFPGVSGISKPVRQLIGKPPETTHFACRWRRSATWGFANGVQTARADSLTIAAGGLQDTGRLSFKTGVFGAIELPKAVRRALWDKTQSPEFEKVVPTFVPEADETRHGVTWRHSARDGAENWVQLE